jgi:hypothetical protein
VRSARYLTAGTLLACLVGLIAHGEALAVAPNPPSGSPAVSQRFQPFAEDELPPADERNDEGPTGYQGIQRSPRQFIEPPAMPVQAAPGPPPVIVEPVSGPRAFLTQCLPQGLIPAWNPTPDWCKDRGIGGPLQTGGWRSQPFSISGFAGATNGGPIERNHVLERPSFYGGANFGWDYDHYWGIEKRLGFGALNLTNAQHQPLMTGLSVTGEYRLMWYPLGDTRWRPFLTTGIGWSDFYFHDDFGHQHIDTLFLFPFGGGLKYLINERLAVRIDMIDELNFGGGAVTTFNYVALTAGLEIRYGKKLFNWPWHKKKQ